MKNYLLGAWNAIDPIYYGISRLHYVPDQEDNNTLFRVRLTRYKGYSVVLSDGTVISKDDLLIKLHLHNVRMISELAAVESDIKKAVLIYHRVRDGLPGLAKFLASHDRGNEIKGVIGITTLCRGAERLGFEKVTIRSRPYSLYKKMTLLPIKHIANTKLDLDPAYLFMSKQQLLSKYPT
ncbi:hypothetical protein ACFO3D_04695 [Virgibacillus kekensis]|uniref:YkoP-like domain-containing protein n=1 Tax=Virgibacillus kekensis TaxID=202261 RepID=A0ABV9DFA6_9BACI